MNRAEIVALGCNVEDLQGTAQILCRTSRTSANAWDWRDWYPQADHTDPEHMEIEETFLTLHVLAS
jgi:hypothetical protein